MNGFEVVIGLLTGMLVGASAVGSGSLVTPLLLLLTSVPAGAAVGTSLALAAGTKLVGYLAHRQMGHVNLGLGKWLIAGALPGAAVAALLLIGLRGMALPAGQARHLLGALLVVLAIQLLATCRRSNLLAAESLPVEPLRSSRTDLRGRALLVGAAVSLVVTLTSVGSGGLLMLALLLWRPVWLRELVGTATWYGLVATLLGTLAHLAIHNVDPVLLGKLAAGSVPGVLLGARLTRLIPERYYQAGIGSLNLALGLRLVLAG